MSAFIEALEDHWHQGRYLCVGLDVVLDRIPSCITGDDPSRCISFLNEIVDATADLVAAYKPNAAFFEALGAAGAPVLNEVIQHIRSVSTATVIVDAKRGDIASSNDGYASFIFNYLKADATTVHPYLGHEAIRPFLDKTDKGIFVLCRTSNPGAGELQDLDVGGEPLFLHLAHRVATDWNTNGNCGLVVGATYPHELAKIRSRVPRLPLLIPGVGAQGGDLEATVRSAFASDELRVLINASRSVLYASDDDGYAVAARGEVNALNSSLTEVLARLR